MSTVLANTINSVGGGGINSVKANKIQLDMFLMVVQFQTKVQCKGCVNSWMKLSFLSDGS